MIASARRRGFSFAEFAVIFVIFGIGVTTLYSMFWSSSEEAFKSKWAYLATQVAREELETLRTTNIFGRRGGAPYQGHDWRPVEGSCLRDIATDELSGVDVYQYPVHYSRIETKVEIEGDPQDRVLTVTLLVRYQEKGSEVYGFQTPGGAIKPIGIYQTLVVDRWFR